MYIYNFLKNHKGISFHMPAHKNRADFIYDDITEIYGADNLRNPLGVIEKSQKKAAEFLGGKAAFYLVNGASSGLISAVASLGETEVYIDRNCHESVINGLIISGGMPHFVYPETDEVFGIPKPLSEDNIPKNCCSSLVYTAVTYYGAVCDTNKIREKAGENCIIISDEAHGAHFYFSKELKKFCALKSDISILSFHKSLPSLTQTAVMLLKGENDSSFLEKCKNMITTTSPSYPLMASLDYAVENGEKVMGSPNLNLIYDIKKEIGEKTDILVYNSDDPWKLLANFKNCNINAEEADKILREKYNIYTEGVFGNNILFMISPYNTEAEIELLKDSLIEVSKTKGENKEIISVPVIKTETVITPREAFFREGETVNPKKAIGKISRENITFFPPCVPIVTAGERITDEIAYYLDLFNQNINIVK